MTSKKEQPVVAQQKRKRTAPAPSLLTASEKAQAVLAVWTERIRPAEAMRVLGVSYLTLQQWQERAMEGMLQALEPRRNLEQGTALSPRLQALLEHREKNLLARSAGHLESRLSSRLNAIAAKPGKGERSEQKAVDIVNTKKKE